MISVDRYNHLAVEQLPVETLQSRSQAFKFFEQLHGQRGTGRINAKIALQVQGAAHPLDADATKTQLRGVIAAWLGNTLFHQFHHMFCWQPEQPAQIRKTQVDVFFKYFTRESSGSIICRHHPPPVCLPGSSWAAFSSAL